MNNKINIIYWSVTGNTELMAQSIYEGSSKNENVRLISVDKSNIDDVKEADILFLGCPSMGNEVLEETEMEPFMESISNNIKDKKIVLFGSYGWGDGEWMQDWEEGIRKYRGELVEDSIISNETQSSEEIAHFSSLGEKYSCALQNN